MPVHFKKKKQSPSVHAHLDPPAAIVPRPRTGGDMSGSAIGGQQSYTACVSLAAKLGFQCRHFPLHRFQRAEVLLWVLENGPFRRFC